MEAQDHISGVIYDETTCSSSRSRSKPTLNDLVRDLGLTKELAQLLGSRLSAVNSLLPGTTFSRYRYRDKKFRQIFKKESDFVQGVHPK